MNTKSPGKKSVKLVSQAKRKLTIAKVIRVHSKALSALADR
jgi:hypothetical protein